jgi:hypothetical protein
MELALECDSLYRPLKLNTHFHYHQCTYYPKQSVVSNAQCEKYSSTVKENPTNPDGAPDVIAAMRVLVPG